MNIVDTAIAFDLKCLSLNVKGLNKSIKCQTVFRCILAVMAAALRLRSAVCSFVVYLLVSLRVCKLAKCPQKRSRDERLSKLTAAKTVNTVNIKAVKPLGDKQVSKKARSQTTGSVKLIGNCEEELPKKPVGRLSADCRPTVG